MKTELSHMQQRLLDAFPKLGVDVSLCDIFNAVYETDVGLFTYTRDIQQKLAPIISRVNSKLTDRRITPGQLKKTYRLELTPKA